ncbi:hypothetical protein [Synechococcus sp. MU1642]|uniref:hypothetical protein n=1 Tax=Synechococcus sp. MU1642 TaxID=2508348 RepID=UPI001CF8F46E|nr:hypothetical protein [Synechococcus sp. MU1642]MCB4407995.1 hypothetical protein [Synechococcus sp. MU1642]
MKKALITLTTQHYNEIWEHSCSSSWGKWATKNNYSIIRFKNELDTSDRAKHRSHAWQKLLAMASTQSQGFDYCYWIDADIFINPKAPDPTKNIDTTKISVTIETGSPYSQEPYAIKQSWLEAYKASNNNISWEKRGYFESWGFNSQKRPLFNTGLVGFSPKIHSKFFQDIYAFWEEGGADTLWGEMIPVNLAIQASQYQILDPKYNRLAFPWSCAWSSPKTKKITNALLDAINNTNYEDDFIRQIFNKSHFLHLAGAGPERFQKYSNIINDLI